MNTDGIVRAVKVGVKKTLPRQGLVDIIAYFSVIGFAFCLECFAGP